MKVRLVQDFETDSIFVIATRQIAKESGEVLTYYLTDQFKWALREPSRLSKNYPRITEDDIPLLASFFVELQKVFSFNEKIKAPVEKELEATRDHLQDMRAIAFKQLGIE